MTFDEWMKYGIEIGYCGPPVCSTHDGIPTSEDEDRRYDDGEDPCIHIVRMYADAEVKAAVEASHPPSKWRNHYAEQPRSDEEEAALKFKLELASTEAEGGSEYPPGHPELGG